MAAVRIKRVYDEPERGDGLRVLVDRLWPRGMTRERARVDLWLKDAAPSDALRRAYHADEIGWEAFRERYESEIGAMSATVFEPLKSAASGSSVVTLLFGSREAQRNHARVLAPVVEEMLR